MLAEAQIKDINGTVLLTPEEIRDALDSGTLDEESIDPTCLTGENGLLQWLWEFFFGKDEEETPQYSGWRTENGKTYYYDQNTHQPVTGIQSIDNKLYYFDASGVQQPATFGIDVSKYQSSIDWDKVKTAGVEFAIIRIGYRGYGSGALCRTPSLRALHQRPQRRAAGWHLLLQPGCQRERGPRGSTGLRLCAEWPSARLPHLL